MVNWVKMLNLVKLIQILINRYNFISFHQIVVIYKIYHNSNDKLQNLNQKISLKIVFKKTPKKKENNLKVLTRKVGVICHVHNTTWWVHTTSMRKMRILCWIWFVPRTNFSIVLVQKSHASLLWRFFFSLKFLFTPPSSWWRHKWKTFSFKLTWNLDFYSFPKR